MAAACRTAGGLSISSAYIWAVSNSLDNTQFSISAYKDSARTFNQPCLYSDISCMVTLSAFYLHNRKRYITFSRMNQNSLLNNTSLRPKYMLIIPSSMDRTREWSHTHHWLTCIIVPLIKSTSDCLLHTLQFVAKLNCLYSWKALWDLMWRAVNVTYLSSYDVIARRGKWKDFSYYSNRFATYSFFTIDYPHN